MITGDNTLTGSNISYSCGMSDLTKQMLICDFRSNKFVEETFIFLS
jgi:magnesium-transporting ATPase (P-type)